MGLLDEAIREHLELKRRSGADPSAIAHEEREALAPVFPDEPAGSGGNGGQSAHDESEAAAIAAAGAVPVADHRDGGDRLMDLSPVGQETVELDMQAVMEEALDVADTGFPAGPTPEGAAPVAYAGGTPAEDLLEREAPSERDGES